MGLFSIKKPVQAPQEQTEKDTGLQLKGGIKKARILATTTSKEEFVNATPLTPPKGSNKEKLKNSSTFSTDSSLSDVPKPASSSSAGPLDPLETDPKITRMNKASLRHLLKKLESKQLLKAQTFNDYKAVKIFFSSCGTSKGGMASFFQVVDAQDSEKNLSYCCKALKRTQLDLSKRLEFIRDIENLTEITSQKSPPHLVPIESVFFEYDRSHKLYFINQVMPWIDKNLLTWLLKTNYVQNLQQSSKTVKIPIPLSKIKRNFEEVRNILISALKGLEILHSNNIIHLNLNFENILVSEQLVIDEDEPGNPIYLSSQAAIASLGIGESIFNFSASGDEFMAPEVKRFCTEENGKNLQQILSDENVSQKDWNLIDKSDYFQTKADIYSFGVILYRLFVDDSKPISKELITKERIKERISTIFATTTNPDSITESFFAELEEIIKSSTDEDPSERCQASNLLLEYNFFKKSAKSEHFGKSFDSNEIFQHALKFLEGKTLKKDMQKARKILERLSEIGNMPARYLLGILITYGFGGYLNIALGSKLLQNAQNDAKKYFEAKILEEDKNEDEKQDYSSSDGFPSFGLGYYNLCSKSFSEAFKYFKRSSDQGNSFGTCFLGFMHANGLFVAKSDPKANELYKIAAEQGNCFGQWKSGLANEKPELYTIAYKYYKAAADQGYCFGQCHLGHMYLLGHGVQKIETLACEYYQMAAEQGQSDAQFTLALNYEIGRGVERSLKKAILWYQKAAMQGDEDAKKSLMRLAGGK